MSFLQPLFLAGLLAAALPLVIHLINRRKAVRRPFPALALLRASNERIARSVKVRQWLLLALRVLALALLALALAKPFVLSSSGLTAEERLPTAVVIVVEDGLSMSHGDWWDQATDEAMAQIGRLRTWDEAALMTTTGQRPVRELTNDHGELRRAMGNLDWRHEIGDLGDALLAANDLVAASQLPNRRIVVVASGTDTAVDPHRELSLSSPVEYISVGAQEGDQIDNLAVTAVDYAQRGPSRDGNWRIDAVVQNFGTSDQSGVDLQLKIDGEVVAATSIDIPAGDTATHRFEHHLEGVDLAEGVVEITGVPGLEADSKWHFLLRPNQQARALLINGSPSSIPYDDELFFLTRALEPAADSGAGIIPYLTTVDGLERRNLEDFDVVLMANVSRLSADDASRLQHFVENGGGLFIAMGNQVDHDAYNQHLEKLLPRPLRGVKRLAERDDPDAPVKVTRMGHPQRTHPIFQSFGVQSGALQSVSIYSHMLLDPAPSDRDTELLLSYQDNAPALLERRVGKGRVLLFTATVDNDWTDFPVRTAYLPLMNRSLLYLARRATSEGDGAYVVGEPVRIDVGDLVSERAIIRDPDGERLVLEPDEGRITMTPGLPGTHTFFADQDGTGHGIDALSFSANVDRSGSALAPLSMALVDQWQADPTAVLTGDSRGQERRINLWSTLLFLVTLALLFETVLGTRRSVLVRTAQKLTFWRSSQDELVER